MMAAMTTVISAAMSAAAVTSAMITSPVKANSKLA